MARHTIFLSYDEMLLHRLCKVLEEMKKLGKIKEYRGRSDESAIEVITDTEHRQEVLSCQAGK